VLVDHGGSIPPLHAESFHSLLLCFQMASTGGVCLTSTMKALRSPETTVVVKDTIALLHRISLVSRNNADSLGREGDEAKSPISFDRWVTLLQVLPTLPLSPEELRALRKLVRERDDEVALLYSAYGTTDIDVLVKSLREMLDDRKLM
jgi:hypothetical protein